MTCAEMAWESRGKKSCPLHANAASRSVTDRCHFSVDSSAKLDQIRYSCFLENRFAVTAEEAIN